MSAGSAPKHQTFPGGKIVVRMILTVLALGGVALGALKIVTSGTAKAASTLEYRVDPTNAATGVYARYGPHVNDTNRVNGYGVYPNETVALLCGVTDGDPVGQYANTTWHFVTDLSNPGEGNFWIADHYLDTPNVASQLTPGESLCPNESSNPVAAQPTLLNPEYDRSAAVNWAIDNAEDPQTADEECAKFVSEALWAGGLPQTSQWNGQGGYWSGNPLHLNLSAYFTGTKTANTVPNLIQYLEKNFSTEWIPLGHMSAGNNDVPRAEVGDIIAYSWGGKGTINHLAFIVGFAKNNPEYPLVAEWGQFDWSFLHYVQNNVVNPSSHYVERGWTWSELDKKYLQQEHGNQNMTAYLLHFNGGYTVPNY